MVSEISLPSPRRNDAKRHALIYFVCGNPGLIEYYYDFFDFLRALLSSFERDTTYDIYGRNLFGFSDDEHPPFDSKNLPLDLESQIEGIYDDVAARRSEGRPYDFVVLMGHSVGAYIAVEIFHRHMKQKPKRSPRLNLRHGILLFPTLTHIALSPSGARMSSFLRMPHVGANAHVYARYLLDLIPQNSIRWIAQNVMGLGQRAAEVTAKWLKSRDGVWQALYLGATEMRTINEEKWEEELWEASEENDSQAPKFFLFYARDDHWVASHIRDAFIEKREEHGLRGGRTKIAVDEAEIKHAFCTKESMSWTVARRVADWVQEIDSQAFEGTEQGKY